MPSWRDTLPIHLAAEFPPMAPDEFAVFVADIKANELISPIVLWLASEEAQAQLLDGRHRLDALEVALGRPVRVASHTCRGRTTWDLVADDDDGNSMLVADLLDAKGFPFGTQVESMVTVLDSDTDPYAYAAAANLHRRHLTTEGKRKAIADLLKLDPAKSNRLIAETVKVDHKTVGAVRAEQEARGEIPHVSTRTDSKGRQQPARKTATKPSPRTAEPRASKASKTENPKLSSLAWSAALPAERTKFLDNVGQDAVRAAAPPSWDFNAISLSAIPTEALRKELERREPARSQSMKEVTVLSRVRDRAGRHDGPTLEADAIPIEETKH